MKNISHAAGNIRYVIGSGWWSSDTNVNPKRKNLGDPVIRSVEFFNHWLSAIQRFTSPQEVIVVDSNAPNKPAPDKRSQVQWVSLPFNAKHATDHIGRWSGWTRSVIVSASYAMASDCDYFVYVEQDCLINGTDVIEHCIENMRAGIAFGSGEGTPQPLQQSFFIIRSDLLPGFLSNLCAIRERDCDLSPEWKFLCAVWWPFVVAANLGLFRWRYFRKKCVKFSKGRWFDFLPIGVGRTRPIPFNEEFFYFQHGTRGEVEQFIQEQEK
ncbi:hypothetical protein [Ruegeria sp. SCP11]|uniref:hypothetical protein n=1 Tax=Ruegeria sp. SCP11 TaxID=3141378 RepID=UPI00333D6863